MRVFSPYANLATMSGLALGAGEGRFVPPASIPDPRTSDANAEKFLRIFGEWAAAREITISQWASDIDDLLKLRAVTCAELQRYNDAAIAHFTVEVNMARKLILAGADPDVVVPPPIPALFGSDIKFSEKPGELIGINVSIPCRRSRSGRLLSVFPDFDKMRVFGKQVQIAGSFTQSGGQLAGLPVLAITWAGRIILAAVIGGAVFLSLREFRKLITGEEVAKLEADMFRADVENDADRGAFALKCMTSSLEALGPNPSQEAISRVRAECIEDATKVFPPKERPDLRAGGLAKGILLSGLGVAAVIGSIAFFRSRQER